MSEPQREEPLFNSPIMGYRVAEDLLRKGYLTEVDELNELVRSGATGHEVVSAGERLLRRLDGGLGFLKPDECRIEREALTRWLDTIRVTIDDPDLCEVVK